MWAYLAWIEGAAKLLKEMKAIIRINVPMSEHIEALSGLSTEGAGRGRRGLEALETRPATALSLTPNSVGHTESAKFGTNSRPRSISGQCENGALALELSCENV